MLPSYQIGCHDTWDIMREVEGRRGLVATLKKSNIRRYSNIYSLSQAGQGVEINIRIFFPLKTMLGKTTPLLSAALEKQIKHGNFFFALRTELRRGEKGKPVFLDCLLFEISERI